MGAGGGLGQAGARLPGVPARPTGLGRGPGPVRELRRHPAVGDARAGGVPCVRPYDNRRRGRLAQLARASPLQGEGRRFEPCSAHQESPISGAFLSVSGPRRRASRPTASRSHCSRGVDESDSSLTCGDPVTRDAIDVCRRIGAQRRSDVPDGFACRSARPLAHAEGVDLSPDAATLLEPELDGGPEVDAAIEA